MDQFVTDRVKDMMVVICDNSMEMDRHQQIEFFGRIAEQCRTWRTAAAGGGIVKGLTYPVEVQWEGVFHPHV